MLCLALSQVADPSPVPPALLNLGAAVATAYIVMLVVKLILEFAGKSGKKDPNADASELMDYRLDKLDEEMKERITRTEYESRHADMLRALQRIEQKIDRMYGSRAVFTGDRPENG
jgi:hypothetical protein